MQAFLCILTSLYSLYRVAFGSTDGEKSLYGKSATRRCKNSDTHAYRTLALRKPQQSCARMPSVLQAASHVACDAWGVLNPPWRPAGLCSERNLTPLVSGFSGGRVKQHPIANPNRHGGEAFGVRTTWGWVQ